MKCWCGAKLKEGKRKVCSKTYPKPHDRTKREKDRLFSDYNPQFGQTS